MDKKTIVIANLRHQIIHCRNVVENIESKFRMKNQIRRVYN